MSQSEKSKNAVDVASTSRAQDDLDAFKQFHDEAHLYVVNAITMDEEGEQKGALMLYERALRLIDQALSFVTEGSNRTGKKWEDIREAQQKLRHTRLQILERLDELRTVQTPSPESPPSEMPPSYEEATKPQWSLENVNEQTSSPLDRKPEGTRISLQQKVSELSASSSSGEAMSEIPPEAESIFSLPEVQLFFVSPEGYVSAPSYPTSLTIYKFIGDERIPGSSNTQTTGWLQVGSWVFPLVPGRSPVLQTNYGAYMFPDINCSEAGAAVGLLLPDSLEEDLRITLESILCELTAFRVEGTTITVADFRATQDRLSKRISAKIIKGAELLAEGVGYGAEITSKLVHKGASSLRHKINPNDEPTNVDPRVQKGLRVARDVTGAAVTVSNFLVRKVGDATVALGRFLAPHIRRQGGSLLSRALREDPSKVNHKVDDVLEVASGGLRGFATVYLSLESAARLLASSLANETVQIVHYRYGGAVGDVTDNTMRAVGNVAMTAYNINAVGVKGIAKKTATSTGKALVEEFEERTMQSGAKPCTLPPSNEKKDLAKS